MSKPRIFLDFCDFHANFPKTDNFFFNLLRGRFDAQICDQPDYLIFGPYGHEHRLHSGVRIWASIEPGRPDFRECDYSVSCCELEDGRHLQLPVYVTNGRAEDLLKAGEKAESILAAKTKFCSFVVSNQHPRKNRNRLEIFEKLSRYKRVDSGGRYLNNIGGPVPGWAQGKVEFLKAYKFNIAFENSSLPGYTTEKIFQPMAARTLPIYWGNPHIAAEFNPRSFLNLADFSSVDALVEKVVELDRDDAKYLEYARQPYFNDDRPNLFFNRERILDFFERIFTTPIVPVARKWKGREFLGRWRLAKRHHWQPGREPEAGAGGGKAAAGHH